MRRIQVLSCGIALVVIGCRAVPNEVAPISIGVITSITGAAANPRNLEAVQLAVEEINAAGGVNGAELLLESRDDATDTARAKEAATELVGLGVPVILGPVNSTRFLAATEVTIAAKRLQLGGAATSPAITSLADDGYVFRTVSSDVNQGRLVAVRAKSKGFTRVALIHAPSVYGTGLANAFETNFVAGGGTVTSKTAITEGLSSYSTVLGEVFAANPKPQAVFLIAVTKDGSQMVKDYATGFSNEGAFWFFSDSLASTDFVTFAGASSFSFQHELVASGTPTTPQYKAFAAAYSARYGADPVGNVQNFYDATYLVALAMTAAASAEPDAIKAKLPDVSRSPGTLYVAGAFAAAVTDLKAGKDVDYDGASGPVDFDDNGDVISGYSIRKVVGSSFQTLEPFVQP